MKPPSARLLVVVAVVGAAACQGNVTGQSSGASTSSTTHETGTGGTGAGGSSTGTGGTASGGGAGGQPSVLGTTCNSMPEDCCNVWAAACLAQGGFLDTCSFGLNCSTAKYAVGADSVCHAVIVPTAGQFGCGNLACDPGQVCHDKLPLGDGCDARECVAAPEPCTATPSCACLAANGFASSGTCTSDAAGNATVRSPGSL